VPRAAHEAEIRGPTVLEGGDPGELERRVALDRAPAEALGELAEAKARPPAGAHRPRFPG
jgi:hypothetical protein